MFKLISAAAAIVGLASAAPTSTSSWYSIPQSARFENDNGVALVAADPIGLYLDVYWNGMSLVDTVNQQKLPGVVPNSPNNCAAYSAGDVATVDQGQPAMTINYADSTIDHFDLTSFYYGCTSATETSVAAKPLSCTITINGYSDYNGQNQVATQTFSYSVGLTDLSAQMNKATVSSGFKGVRRVNFYVSNDAVTAALIDTVGYVVYSASQISK